MCHLSFSVYVMSPNLLSASSIHLSTSSMILLFFIAEYYFIMYMYYIFIIYSWSTFMLFAFPSFVIITAMHMAEQVFVLWDVDSFEILSDITRPNGEKFLRFFLGEQFLHTDFHSCWTSFQVQWMRVPSPYPLEYLLCSGFLGLLLPLVDLSDFVSVSYCFYDYASVRSRIVIPPVLFSLLNCLN